MTTVVQQQSSIESRPPIPPSVLLIGKKRTLDYVAPALYRINNTGELIIKATGSLSIVTAVDVAEIVKRDVAEMGTQSVTIGTDELKIATGDVRRMSCIEIHLIKVNPMAVVAPTIETPVTSEATTSFGIEIPVEGTSSDIAEVPVIAVQKTKPQVAKKKRKASAKKKSTKKKSVV